MEERYYVEKQLAVVPYGKRFQGRDTADGQPIFVHRFYKGDSDEKERWYGEFSEWSAALSRVNAGIVPELLVKGEDEDGMYVVTGRREGVRLVELVDAGYMGLGAVREFAKKLLEGVDAAAKESICHGAYDPRQITVGVENGKQVFTVDDFGLPFIHGKIQGEERFMGLAPFVSVRQAGGEAQDVKGELFSISQLLFYCLSMGHPYSASGLEEIGEAYRGGQVPSLADHREGLPSDFLEWHQTLSGGNGVSGFEDAKEALDALPEVPDEGVLDVERIGGELALARTAAAAQGVTGAGGSVKLITGSVAVKPASQLAAEAGMEGRGSTAACGGDGIEGVGGGKKRLFVIIGSVVGVLILLGVIVAMIGGDGGEDDEGTSAGNGGLSEEELARLRVPEDGLLLAWNFDGVLESSKEGGVDLKALNRARFEEGVDGESLVIGPNSYYRIPFQDGMNLEALEGYTLTFWVRANVQWARGPVMIANKAWARGTGEAGWVIAGQQAGIQKLGFQWHAGGGEGMVNFDRTIGLADDEWQMLTVVGDGAGGTTFYLNGVEIGKVSIPRATMYSSTADWFVGCDTAQESRFSSDLLIDQLYVWTRPLDPEEIRAIFEERQRYIP